MDRRTSAALTRTFKFENGVLEFESGFPVADSLTGLESIVATVLPKGLVATTIHFGSQETSEHAYKAIHELSDVRELSGLACFFLPFCRRKHPTGLRYA